MEAIKNIFYVIGLFLIPMVCVNVFIYLIGAFIAWDWNPGHWLLFTTVWGRVIAIVLEITIFVRSPELIEDL